MPGNVAAASASAVMPGFLSSQFNLSSAFEVDINYYVDGSGQAKAMASTARKTWRATIPCSSTLLGALRDFWLARKSCEPFYFYFWRETTPLGSVDLTGMSVVGRYVVKFNSPWAEEFTLGRAAINVELIEAL